MRKKGKVVIRKKNCSKVKNFHTTLVTQVGRVVQKLTEGPALQYLYTPLWIQFYPEVYQKLYKNSNTYIRFFIIEF